MSDQQKPPAKVRPGYEHYGEMKEPVVKPTLGSRVGNWLAGLLMPWAR